MGRLFPLLAFLAACGSTPKEHRRTPELQAKYDAAIARNEATYGMRKDEVRKAIGEPARKDRVTLRDRTYDRWGYTFSEIYFDDDGYVVRIMTP